MLKKEIYKRKTLNMNTLFQINICSKTNIVLKNLMCWQCVSKPASNEYTKIQC